MTFFGTPYIWARFLDALRKTLTPYRIIFYVDTAVPIDTTCTLAASGDVGAMPISADYNLSDGDVPLVYVKADSAGAIIRLSAGNISLREVN